MDAREIIGLLWVAWFGAILLWPLFHMKPEKRFYGEHDDKDT